MFLRNFKIDTSRAREFWPRQVDSLEELPAPYRPYLQKWLDQGMPVSQIIFVRQTNHWVTEKPEYVVAWHKNRVLHVQRHLAGGVIPTEFSANTVLYALYAHRLLDNRLTVCFQGCNGPQKVLLHFNAAKEDLFYPLFELLLQNAFTKPGEARERNQAETVASLREKTYKMCGYLELMYRFGDTISAYFWDKNITPEQQKRNEKSLKRIEDTEYLAGLMEQGVALEKISENCIDLVYVFRHAVRQVSLQSAADGSALLAVAGPGAETFYVPVKQQNLSEAQDFVRACADAQRRFAPTADA